LFTGWYFLTSTPTTPAACRKPGPQERLSATGDNLPNVIQYLREQHPDRLNLMLATLARRIHVWKR